MYDLLGGLCREVNPRMSAQIRAAHALIRPNEVSDLIRMPVPRHPLDELLSPTPALADQVANFLAGNFRYVRDPHTRDIWCSPEHTRRKGHGDCEDLSILGLSLILAAGGQAELAVGRFNGEGHAWIEGTDRKGVFRLEATNGYVDRTQALFRFYDPYTAQFLVGKDHWRWA